MSNVVPNGAKCEIGYREERFALYPIGPPGQLARTQAAPGGHDLPVPNRGEMSMSTEVETQPTTATRVLETTWAAAGARLAPSAAST